MVKTVKAIEAIQKGFEKLREFHQLVEPISPDLVPDDLVLLQASVLRGIKAYKKITRELEVKVNAVRLYWFPETVDQLDVGAYKTVRHPPVEQVVSAAELPTFSCSVCQEPFSPPATGGAPIGEVVAPVPVVLKRRCTLNPLLEKCCDQPPCQCTYPPFCLKCALDHVLKNCIHEGKSSVRCPMCRGEFCIYDLQEVTLVKDTSEEDRLELQRLRQLVSEMPKFLTFPPVRP